MIWRKGTRTSFASSGVTKILRDEGSGPVVTAGMVVPGLERMFMRSSCSNTVVCFRHCEERKLPSNPVLCSKRSGLLRFARNDGGYGVSRHLRLHFQPGAYPCVRIGILGDIGNNRDRIGAGFENLRCL